MIDKLLTGVIKRAWPWYLCQHYLFTKWPVKTDDIHVKLHITEAWLELNKMTSQFYLTMWVGSWNAIESGGLKRKLPLFTKTSILERCTRMDFCWYLMFWNTSHCDSLLICFHKVKCFNLVWFSCLVLPSFSAASQKQLNLSLRCSSCHTESSAFSSSVNSSKEENMAS